MAKRKKRTEGLIPGASADDAMSYFLSKGAIDEGPVDDEAGVSEKKTEKKTTKKTTKKPAATKKTTTKKKTTKKAAAGPAVAAKAGKAKIPPAPAPTAPTAPPAAQAVASPSPSRAKIPSPSKPASRLQRGPLRPKPRGAMGRKAMNARRIPSGGTSPLKGPIGVEAYKSPIGPMPKPRLGFGGIAKKAGMIGLRGAGIAGAVAGAFDGARWGAEHVLGRVQPGVTDVTMDTLEMMGSYARERAAIRSQQKTQMEGLRAMDSVMDLRETMDRLLGDKRQRLGTLFQDNDYSRLSDLREMVE